MICSEAQTLTWDANGTGAGQTNGAGSWQGTNLWWNGAANQDWINGVDAVIGGASSAGATITITSNPQANSITFGTYTGSYTIQGTSLTLTQGGITVGNTAGGLTFRGTGTAAFLTLAGDTELDQICFANFSSGDFS